MHLSSSLGHCAAVFFALTGICFAQISPISSGDSLTIEVLDARQTGREPINFSNKRASYTYSIRKQSNGDRHFVGVDGKVAYINDVNFTQIEWLGRPIPEGQRFHRLPQGSKVAPGEAWNVPEWKHRIHCGDAVSKMSATSEVGPSFEVLVDGKTEQIRTIRIKYEGENKGCDFGKRSIEVLYSPDLDELVSSAQVYWDNAGDGKTFLWPGVGGGSKWVVKSIQRAAAK